MTPDPDLHPEFYEGINAKRLIAWILDMVMIALVCVLILPFTFFTGIFYFPALLLVVGFLYRVITLTNGSATLGMRMMAMELRDSQDLPFDLGLAFWHTLGYSISLAMFPLQLISIVLMCTGARRQGLTDLILGTVPMNRRQQGAEAYGRF